MIIPILNIFRHICRKITIEHVKYERVISNNEADIFYLTLSGEDVTPRKVEILSPTERKITENSIIPINVKVTNYDIVQ